MIPDAFHNRLHPLNEKPSSDGPVVYWMSRDQRILDNQALLCAQQEAIRRKVPLAILFCLSPVFSGASYRQYDFMLNGLKEVEKEADRLNIPLTVRAGDPVQEAAAFAASVRAGLLVTDFSPLKIHREWKEQVGKRISARFCEVDAHNIVPCRWISGKPEFAARTIRPKIRGVLDGYLTEIPPVIRHPWSFTRSIPGNDWKFLDSSVMADRTVPPVTWLVSGEIPAGKVLDDFIGLRLAGYDTDRNDPNLHAQSDLSPYLHFGQISSLRVALKVREAVHSEGSMSYLEELIIRKELSDNFCLYNQKYDQIDGIPVWGRQTLRKHWSDSRPYVYTLEEFEAAGTRDPLWNSAQTELLQTGKMHGYMRMYWAKKILEWSVNPEQAFHIAVYLNDKYSLDGCDPNGYAGISWSIGGTHDRPWKERPVFGTIRYMSLDGCRRKFDVDRYIDKWKGGGITARGNSMGKQEP